MLKRILSLFLALTLVFSAMPVYAAAETTDEGAESSNAELVAPASLEEEPTEPEATEPEATEPEVTEPEVTEPEVTEPEATEPEVTEPEVTEPEVTEPEVTEPEVTEPEVTEPEVTEPEVTEPEVTEPETTEPLEESDLSSSKEAAENVEAGTAEPTVLEQGVPASFTMEPYEVRCFKFTVPADGRYVVRNDSEDTVLVIPQYDDGTIVGYYTYMEKDGANWMTYAEEGTTYLLEVRNEYDYSKDVELVWEETVGPDKLELWVEEITGVVGAQSVIDFECVPAYTDYEKIVWTVDDSNIISITPSWSVVDVDCLAAGTATITATLPNGKKYTVDVTVNDVSSIALDENKTVDLGYNEKVGYLFTPAEDGEYYFSAACEENYLDLSVYNGDEYVKGGQDECKIALTAGVTYTLIVENYNNAVSTVLSVKKCVPATGLSLRLGNNKTSLFLDDYSTVYLELEPANAIEEAADWAISDESVLEWTWKNNEQLGIHTLKCGEATVTATTASGITGSITIAVTEEPAIPISVGDSQNHTLQGSDSRVKFSFTPEETATYVIWSDFDSGRSPDFELYEGDSHLGSNDTIIFEGVEGTTYTIFMNHWDEEPYTYNISLDKAQPVESIDPRYDVYSGLVGEEIGINFRVLPETADASSIKWTVGNESIAEINSSNNHFVWLDLKQVGTTTLTATSGDVTASCTIKVVEPAPISSGYSESHSYLGGEDLFFKFTPEEDGTYVVWNSDVKGDGCAFEVECDGEGISGGYDRAVFEAEADVTYQITCSGSSESGTVTVNLDKGVPLERLILDETSVTDKVGRQVHLNLTYYPLNGIAKNVHWSIGDETIAKFNYRDTAQAGIQLLKEGTTTVTAACDDITATCEIIAEDIAVQGEIEAGFSQDVTLGGEETVSFGFTPEESGYYVLWEGGTKGPRFEVAYPDGGINSGYKRLQFYAEEGQLYILTMESNYTESVETFQMNMDECAELTDIRIQSSISGVAGDRISIPVEFEPANAYVAEIQYDYDPDIVSNPYYGGATSVPLELLKAGTTELTVSVGGISATCQITVNDLTQIEAGETLSVTLSAQQSAGYSFTAKSSGNYVFRETSGQDPYMYTIASDGGRVTGYGRLQFYAEAGQTYTLFLENNYLDDMVVEYQVKVEKCAALQSIKLNPTSISGVTGDEVYIDVTYVPANAYVGDVVYSYDDGIVDVKSYSNFSTIWLDLLKAGTTSLKVSVGGKSATCNITVTEPLVVYDGYKGTVTIGANQRAGLVFTPEESGYYTLWDENHWFPYFRLLDSNGNQLEGSQYRMQFYAEAGQTYSILVYNGYEEKTSFQLQLKACEELTQILLPQKYYMDVGEWVSLSATLMPANGYAENLSFVWDDEYLEATQIEQSVFGAVALKAGITEVTVRDGNGLEATCTLVIGDVKAETPVLTAETDPVTGKINLSWTGDVTAKEYKVYRATSEGGRYSLVKTTEETSLYDTTAAAGKTYYYYVVAHGLNGTKSDKSEIASAHCTLAQPVITLTRDPATGLVKISWAKVSGAKTYEVYRSYSEAGEFELVGSTTSASFTDADADVGILSCYKVKALGSKEEYNSIDSEIESEMRILAQPEITVDNDAATGCPRVSWDAIDLAVGYEVYRSENEAEGYEKVDDTDAETLIWLDEDAVSGKTYSYKVVAVAENTEGNSMYSDADSGAAKLEAPAVTISNVAATGKIQLDWEAVEGAAKYEIYRATSAAGKYTRVKTLEGTETTYTDTSAKVNTTYHYKVRAIADLAAANSAYSDIVNITCNLAQPEITVESVASTGAVKITWKKVSSVKRYQVWRAGEDGEYSLIKTTTSTSFTDTTGDVGTTYSYYVVAAASKEIYNSAASAAASQIVKLAQPVITVANDAETGYPQVSWKAIDSAVAYDVYRSENEAEGYEKVDSTDAETLVWLDEAAEPGTTYEYKVVAVAGNTDANSADSAVKSGAAKLEAPVVSIENVAATGKIQLDWEAVEGAVKYQVYRATSKNGKYTLVKTVTETELTDTSAKVNTTYHYKVRAIADLAAANSAYSEIVFCDCKLAQPAITVESVASTGNVKITWKKVSSAKKYEIYRVAAGEEFGEDLDPIKTTTSTSFTDTTGQVGVTYTYRVRAAASKEKYSSAYSAEESQIFTLACPVISITNDADSGRPLVSWKTIEDAVSYAVYRSGSDGVYAYIDSTDESKMEWLDAAAVPGTTCEYKVVAIAENTDANSADSNVKSVVAKLAKPEIIGIDNDEETGKIHLTWSAVEGAAGYKLYRATSKNGKYTLVKAVEGTEYTDTTAKGGTTYYYKVVAAMDQDSANSAYSEYKDLICRLAKPEITVEGVASTGAIKISWNKISNRKQYQVWRTDLETGEVKRVKTTTSTSYTDTSGEVGKTYSYYVIATASKSAANSEPSIEKAETRRLACPVVTVSNDAASGNVPKLSWKAVKGAVAYDVYYSESKDGEYQFLGSTAERNYVHDNAPDGKTYYYVVVAVAEKENGSSAYSAAKAGAAKLEKTVIQETGYHEDTGKIWLRWDAVDGAVNYKVYRATSKNGKYTLVKTVEETEYTDTTAKGGTTYYYKVIAGAELSSANSAYSDYKSEVCRLAKPEITVEGVASTGAIKISWNKISNRKQYQVWRTDLETGEVKRVKTTTSTSFTDTTGEVGKTYSYYVIATASKSAANSEPSSAKTETRRLACPVVSVTIDAATDQPKLSWKAVKGAVGYEVYCSTGEDGQYVPVDGSYQESKDGKTFYYVDLEAQDGVTNYYVVVAVADAETGAGNSAYSAVKTGAAKLAEPEITGIGNDEATGKIWLTWSAVEGAKEYKVYRATSKSGKYSRIGTVEETEYTDATAKVGTKYYYKVIAGAELSSANSDYSEYKDLICKLAQPQITVTNTSSGTVKISWKKVSSAKKYEVYRCADGETFGKPIKTTTSTSYTDTSAEVGTTYYYYVVAVASKTAANSAGSAIVDGTRTQP